VNEKTKVRSELVALKAEITKFLGNAVLSDLAFCGEVTKSPSEILAV
jgi:hypothetical protein